MTLSQFLTKVKLDQTIINTLNKDTFYVPLYDVFKWFESEGEYCNKQFKLKINQQLINLRQLKADYFMTNLSTNQLDGLLNEVEAELEQIIERAEQLLAVS